MTFRKQLIFILLGVVCLNFLVVFICFQVMVKSYIQRETMAQLTFAVEELEAFEGDMETYEITFDTQANDGQTNWIQVMELKNPIIDTSYVILDQNGQTIYQSEPDSIIVDFYENNKTALAAADIIEMKKTAGVAYATVVPYQEDYNLLMYADGTVAMELAGRMNRILALLMAGAGGIAVTAGILMSRGLREAIRRLGEYAAAIGTGDFAAAAPETAYQEMKQLGQEMEQMAKMLNSYHERQQKFFQDASHQLRTPLMSIQGYGEGLQQGVFDDPDEALQVILNESQEMGRLVSQLLHLSKSGQGLQERLENQHVSLNQVVQQAVEKVRQAAYSQAVTVNYIEEGGDCEIFGNAGELQSGILNILLNSLRYCQSNIEVRLKRKAADIYLSIEDDGDGIDTADLPYIFERFYTGRGGQSGLGLSLAREIVTAHGGEIQAENTARGARFVISFRP